MYYLALYRNSALILPILTLLCFPVFLYGGILRAESENLSEYRLKAEFICNFAKFVRWPGEERPENPLVICILGQNPFGEVRKYLEDKKVRGRNIRFVQYGEGKKIIRHIRDKTEKCHILFISSSEKDRFPEILSGLQMLPILTVGDSPGFAADGGMINLVHTGARLRFEINTEAAERSGITISSQLLKLAAPLSRLPEKDESL